MPTPVDGSSVSPPILQIQDRRDAAAFHLNLSRMGGDVVSYRLGSRPAHLVNTPDLAQWVLERNEGNYENQSHPYAELGVYYTDAACSLLRIDRRGVDRSRTKQQLAESLAHEAAGTAERWIVSSAASGPVDIAAELEPMVFRHMCRALFDVDGHAWAHEFVRAVGFLEQCLANDVAPHGDDPLAHAYTNAIRVQDAATEWIARAAGMAAPDEPVPERRCKAVVRTLMNGYNATATALTWTILLLAQHGDIQAAVHAELDQAESNDPGALNNLRMVVMESLRLYPPAWILARVARCAERLGDTAIAAGDLVSISPYTMHRLARVWPEPSAFRPERFTAAATRERPTYAYFPFGGGTRRCTAASHMIGQLQATLSVLLRRCQFTTEPGTDVRPRGLVALHPTPAVRLHVRARV